MCTGYVALKESMTDGQLFVQVQLHCVFCCNIKSAADQRDNLILQQNLNDFKKALASLKLM